MIIGVKELETKLKKIEKLDLSPGVKKAIAHVQGEAKSLCSGFRMSSGELRRSIYTTTEDEGDTSRGICYTNKKYAPYVEFGTGPTGQSSHAGISPNVDVAYSQTGWMIPASAMSLEEAQFYGFGIAKGKDGNQIGYYTNGQPAHPFMYPALKNSQEDVVEIIASHIRSQL